MRLFIDECLPRVLVDELMRRGHDVAWARTVCPGASDDVVLALANSENRILMSEDRDFGDLVIRQGRPAVGIVRVRMSAFPGLAAQIALRVADEVDQQGTQLRGFLTTIEFGRTRRRALPNPV